MIGLLLEADRGQSRTAYEIARLARCTPAYAYAYAKKLQNKRFVRGTTVVRPRELIEYWMTIREKPRAIDYFVPDPVRLLAPTPPRRYASTTYLAESRMYHYLVPVRWDLYIRGADEVEWAAACRSLGALRGPGNVRLLVGDPWIVENASENKTPLDPALGAESLKWVGDPRLVLDLLVEGSVGVEAAELIMERRGWGQRTRMQRRS